MCPSCALFPRLERFTNHAHQTADHSGLSHASGLTHLDIDAKAKLTDLGALVGLDRLRHVRLEKCRGAAALARLPALTDVTLVGVNLGKKPLEWSQARRVTLVRPKGALPILPQVEHLKLNASTVEHLDAVAGYPSLRSLELNTVRGLRRLPDLSGLPHLRRLSIYRARDLTDLSALEHAPRLQTLSLRESPGASGALARLSCAHRWPEALSGEENPHQPFVRSERAGVVTLRLDGPCVAPERFERAGLLENGHSWGRLAEALLPVGAPVQLDCEADAFVATGEAEAVDALLADLLALVVHPASLGAAMAALV